MGETLQLFWRYVENYDESIMYWDVLSTVIPLDSTVMLAHMRPGQNLYFHSHRIKMENAVDTEKNTMLDPFKMNGFNRSALPCSHGILSISQTQA